jgi:glycerol transport system ATP-binding protein
MNFIPVEKSVKSVKDDGHVCFRNINLSISKPQQAALQNNHSTNLKLGIRPEFIELSEKPKPHSIVASVVSVQHLGSYQIVTVDFAGLEMQVRVAEKMQLSGAKVYLGFPSQWLKLYIDEYLVGEPALEDTHDIKADTQGQQT